MLWFFEWNCVEIIWSSHLLEITITGSFIGMKEKALASFSENKIFLFWRKRTESEINWLITCVEAIVSLVIKRKSEITIKCDSPQYVPASQSNWKRCNKSQLQIQNLPNRIDVPLFVWVNKYMQIGFKVITHINICATDISYCCCYY